MHDNDSGSRAIAPSSGIDSIEESFDLAPSTCRETKTISDLLSDLSQGTKSSTLLGTDNGIYGTINWLADIFALRIKGFVWPGPRRENFEGNTKSAIMALVAKFLEDRPGSNTKLERSATLITSSEELPEIKIKVLGKELLGIYLDFPSQSDEIQDSHGDLLSPYITHGHMVKTLKDEPEIPLEDALNSALAARNFEILRRTCGRGEAEAWAMYNKPAEPEKMKVVGYVARGVFASGISGL